MKSTRVLLTWVVLLIPLAGFTIVGAVDSAPAVRQLTLAPKVFAFTPKAAEAELVKRPVEYVSLSLPQVGQEVRTAYTHQQPEQPKVELPKEVKGSPGEFIRVPATTNGAMVSWMVIDPGLNLFPSELQNTTKVAVVSGIKNGRYRIVAVTALGGSVSPFATCTVIIGDAPEPDPKVPPDPKPDPVDPFANSLRLAFAVDGGDKAVLAKLISTYKMANMEFLSKCASVKALTDTMHDAVNSQIGAALPKVRRMLADELNKQLPATTSTILTDELRGRYSAQFQKFVKALEGL